MRRTPVWHERACWSREHGAEGPTSVVATIVPKDLSHRRRTWLGGPGTTGPKMDQARVVRVCWRPH